MLEAHEWDDVLGRLVGVQFRGTERIASATSLDALGVAQDKESKTESQKAGAVTTLHDAQDSNLPNQAGRFGRLATRRFSPKLSVPIRLTPALSPHRPG